MKWIDFDGLFDEKLTQYMAENKDKHTEREWENVIPKLYKKFGDTKIAKIGCTPKEYYARMSDTELVETLSGHLAEDVPVPEFLCAEIETRGVTETLLPLLKQDDVETASYVINLIGDDERAFDAYFDVLIQGRFTEDVRSDVTDILRLHADEVKARTLKLYAEGKAEGYTVEILSCVKEKSDEVYEILLKEFTAADNVSVTAGYLAAYGDERALTHLYKKIEDVSVGFVEFQELKYAIEALGGEYNEPRDFSSDKDYLAIEAASAKEGVGNHTERS